MTTAKNHPTSPYYSQENNFGIGASDALLLLISVIGFGMLAWSIYAIVVAKLKTAEELQQEAEELTYEETLARVSDVSKLNRAQRRVRAKYIAKQQRKQLLLSSSQNAGEGGENGNQELLLEADPNNNNNNEDADDEMIPAFRHDTHLHNTNHGLSRRERQKAAKQIEMKERTKLRETRHREQQLAQRDAASRKQEKLETKKLETQRRLEEARIQRQRDEHASYEKWRIFLQSTSSNSLSVQEWIRELQTNRVVYIKNLARRFGVDEITVANRIQELIDTKRLSGILEQETTTSDDTTTLPARFIYLSPRDMRDLAAYVKTQDRIVPSEFASHIQQLLAIG